MPTEGSPVVAGDLRLSLLLSQLVGSQEVRELLALQLADWHRLQADVFIRDERLRIFCLLAGKPVSGAAGAHAPASAAVAGPPFSSSGLPCSRCGSCRRKGPSTFAPNWTGSAPSPSTCGSCFLPRPPSPRPSVRTKLPSRLVAAGAGAAPSELGREQSEPGGGFGPGLSSPLDALQKGQAPSSHYSWPLAGTMGVE